MKQIFFPFEISKMAISEVKKAYSELRSVANKRLSRLESQGLGSYGSYRFPKVRDLTENQIRSELAETSRYLRDPRHTVRGEKAYMKREIESLHDQGYDFIDESNFYEFTDYMDDLRDQYGAKAFDSGDAADVFNNSQKIGIDPELVKENFEYFAEHLSELERMKPARSASGATMPAVRRKIRRLTQK